MGDDCKLDILVGIEDHKRHEQHRQVVDEVFQTRPQRRQPRPYWNFHRGMLELTERTQTEELFKNEAHGHNKCLLSPNRTSFNDV